MSAAAVCPSTRTTISVTLESTNDDQAATGEVDRGAEIASASAVQAAVDEEVVREEASDLDRARERTNSVPQPPPPPPLLSMSDRAMGGAPQLPIAPSQEHLLRTGEDKQFLE